MGDGLAEWGKGFAPRREAASGSREDMAWLLLLEGKQ